MGNARSLGKQDGNRYRFLRFFHTNHYRQRGEDRGIPKHSHLMRRMFFSLLAVISGMLASAQSVSVAVLHSGEDVKTFYGNASLIQACQAAIDGDVITLSPGVFESPDNLTKSLTIKGAGMDNKDANCTRITAKGLYLRDFTQESADNATRLENLYFDGHLSIFDSRPVVINKCSIPSVGHSQRNPGKIEISNCHIFYDLSLWGPSMVSNSVFEGSISIEGNIAPAQSHYFTNCIFHRVVYNSTIEYSIFVQGSGDTAILPSSSSASTCKYIGTQEQFFRDQNQNADNECLTAEIQVFKPDTFYELTDEYSTKWLGKDNTQIGIYGGPEPFSLIPSNPRITKFNVASRTSADGKLSVDIEVANPTK